MNMQLLNYLPNVIQMIKAGEPVFFGCDVGKFSDSTAGIMDTALFEYEVFIESFR
jgi:bleomycin hydrolase